jgi:hypothetical protein
MMAFVATDAPKGVNGVLVWDCFREYKTRAVLVATIIFVDGKEALFIPMDDVNGNQFSFAEMFLLGRFMLHVMDTDGEPTLFHAEQFMPELADRDEHAKGN